MKRIHIEVAKAAAWEATSAERAAVAARVRDRSRRRLGASAARPMDLAEPRRVRDPLLRVRRAPGVEPIVARGPPASRWRRMLARWREWLTPPHGEPADPAATSTGGAR